MSGLRAAPRRSCGGWWPSCSARWPGCATRTRRCGRRSPGSRDTRVAPDQAIRDGAGDARSGRHAPRPGVHSAARPRVRGARRPGAGDQRTALLAVQRLRGLCGPGFAAGGAGHPLPPPALADARRQHLAGRPAAGRCRRPFWGRTAPLRGPAASPGPGHGRADHGIPCRPGCGHLEASGGAAPDRQERHPDRRSQSGAARRPRDGTVDHGRR